MDTKPSPSSSKSSPAATPPPPVPEESSSGEASAVKPPSTASSGKPATPRCPPPPTSDPQLQVLWRSMGWCDVWSRMSSLISLRCPAGVLAFKMGAEWGRTAARVPATRQGPQIACSIHIMTVSRAGGVSTILATACLPIRVVARIQEYGEGGKEGSHTLPFHQGGVWRTGSRMGAKRNPLFAGRDAPPAPVSPANVAATEGRKAAPPSSPSQSLTSAISAPTTPESTGPKKAPRFPIQPPASAEIVKGGPEPRVSSAPWRPRFDGSSRQDGLVGVVDVLWRGHSLDGWC
jgi:hypothetical protein